MFRQKPPGEGGKGRPVQFSYIKTLNGQTWTAWLAGPPQWIECHTHPEQHTKPCLRWITNGALPCPRCAPTWNRETIGYVPLYRETDHRECLVVLREVSRELIEGLEFPCYVLVNREWDKGDPLTVSRIPKQKKWSSSLPRRQVAADLQYSLLTLWRINELTEWVRSQAGSTIVPPVKIDANSVPTESTGMVSLNSAALVKSFEDRAAIDAETATRSAKNAEFARRAAERNGKPHTS